LLLGYVDTEQRVGQAALFEVIKVSFKNAINSNLSLMLSTSGTTGSSKMVKLTRRNIESNAESISDYLDIDVSECAVASLPFFYSYGLSVLNSHLKSGASIVLTSESVVRQGFWAVFNKYKCTSFAGVPMQYEMLFRIGLFEKISVPTLKKMTQAGGRLKDKFKLKISSLAKNFDIEMYVMYGQTEATARMSYLDPKCVEKKLGSVGKPIPGGELFVETETGLTTSSGIIGEVVYKGPNVMLGLAESREDLASGDILKGVLKTGDIGYFDEDGFLYLSGRNKRIAKVFGLRINLDEVEQSIESICTAAAIADGERITVFCAETNISADVIRTKLSDFFKINHNAFQVKLIDALPTTSSGKVNYTVLVGNQ
jgi:long-chain acyl-CoA synthetase